MNRQTWNRVADACYILAGTLLLSGLARTMHVEQMFLATGVAAAISTATVMLVRRRVPHRPRHAREQQ